MADTKIEWADATFNPITGCTPISEGCEHCYAKRMATRLAGRYGYPADDPFRVTVHWDRIEEPLHWVKSRRIFVCSMGDLFHNDVPLNVTKDIFDVMRQAGNLYGHTFMVLTKRPKRMAEFIDLLQRDKGPDFRRWPLPFVWLGVTAENQARADERIPILLQIPAAVRFVSIEPMLGPISTRIHTPITGPGSPQPAAPPSWNVIDTLTRYNGTQDHKGRGAGHVGPKLGWVICGGETGPGARPMELSWARDLRDQCKASGVPFFFKKVAGKRETPEDLNIREVPTHA